MINLLQGTVAEITADSATLLTAGGVGYQVFCPSRSLGALAQGQPATLHTYLAVREDALTLYGFADKTEKAVFTLLLGVSGVGPRMALSLLSTWNGHEIMTAIHTAQPSVLAKASGVGKKLAEKIIVELKDKKAPLSLTSSLPASALAPPLQTDVASALVNLGFPISHAEAAAKATLDEMPNADFAELFKHALKKVR
ncbi:MAG: Holliday junction branch migration protein RuvA [Alphaproteobacteria bacterium CG_4_10_14_0_8_um_filter_53_9]|nr:MAG: Holliday junction branch migration protein RuvA [Alphaproteobacteria bacterium CG_4_10_14_0_8_um_filter_53_9]